MTRRDLIRLAFLAPLAACGAAGAVQDDPIIGTWKFMDCHTDEDLNALGTMTFGADGSWSVSEVGRYPGTKLSAIPWTSLGQWPEGVHWQRKGPQEAGIFWNDLEVFRIHLSRTNETLSIQNIEGNMAFGIAFKQEAS